MPGRQQEKSIRTRNGLMEASVKLFGEKGFMATTISDITGEAGYAKGNFYRYWKSKDEIFLDIMQEKLKGYRGRRDESFRDVKNLEEVIHRILDFLDSIIDDRNWSKVFLEFTVHASRNEELKQELHKGVYRLSNAIFADLVKPFVDSGYSPEKMGALNTALFEGYLIHNILGTGLLDRDDFRQAAVTLALSMGRKDGANT